MASETQPAPPPRLPTHAERLVAALERLPGGFATVAGGEHFTVTVNARDLLAALRDRSEFRSALALCLPFMVETAESMVHCHSTTFDWTIDEPLPPETEPEALIEAEAMLRAIAAAKAALDQAPPA
ncbi:hypothetical protein [Synechococcus phage MinM1]|nr:hypothetical protein [Synechococcus phage MinM1]